MEGMSRSELVVLLELLLSFMEDHGKEAVEEKLKQLIRKLDK